MGRVARVAVLALWATGLAAPACKRAPGGAPDGGATAAPSAPDPAAQVLVRVGDRTITVGEYTAALQHMDQFDRIRYQAPERRRELLGEMVDVMLLADEARAQGYDKDPVTQHEIREILRDAMLKKAREGAPGPDDVPEERVRAYFDAHRDDFHDPERRRVSAIVLATEGAAAAALELAAKASPTEWGELVRAKSVDAQARSAVPPDLAGDLGFVSPPGDPRGANPRVPEAVRAAVFEIAKVGEVLGRVVRDGGKFYVVKLGAKTDPHDRTLQDAERAIRVKLAQDEAHAREQALLDELRKEIPVQIDEAALAQVRVDLSSPDGGY